MAIKASARAKESANKDASDSKSTKRRRGSTVVYEELRADILSLKISPGTAIDEVALAKRFNVSRTPVREALLMLSREDLVTFLPGRSAIVTPHSMSNAHEYMDAFMLLSRAINQIAAETRTEETITTLRAYQDAYSVALKNGDDYKILDADLAFHRTISAASGNKFLDHFYRLALDYGRRMQLLYYYPFVDNKEKEQCAREHEAMVESIARQDMAASDRLASEHVMSELRVIQRSLEPKVGVKLSLHSEL